MKMESVAVTTGEGLITITQEKWSAERGSYVQEIKLYPEQCQLLVKWLDQAADLVRFDEVAPE